MNKHYRIILLILLLVIWGVFLVFYKIRDLDFSSGFVTKFFVRNLTWQTDFRESVPYKKGDEIEYSWIFTSDSWKDIDLDISTIKNTIDIEHILLDDKEIREADLKNLQTKDSSLLKITGKAKKTDNNNAAPVVPIKLLETTKEAIKNETIKTEDIVSPPETESQNIAITQTKYNSNINNLLTFRGQELGNVKFVNIGEKRIRPVYSSGSLYVQVEKDTFTTGDYFVFLTLKTGKILTPNIHLSFEYSSSPINIANITPKTIQNSEERFVVIQGNGFDKIVSIQLSNNLILKNAEFKIINNQVAWVKIPKDLPVGEYYFNIMDTHSIYELKNMSFSITH